MSPCPSRRVVAISGWCLVATVALASTTMFVAQGGFGRGHLHLDRPIGFLALPWVLVPWDVIMEPSDFVRFCVLPLLCNSLVWAALHRLLLPRKQPHA